MAEKTSGKQISINLIASVIAFFVTTGINFFLTPYLVAELGEEAYGFIGLSTNFVQYATVVTSALNSMAGRFVSVAYHKGQKEKASRLFSSVLVADLILAGALLVISAVVTFYLDWFLVIPAELVTTVKITFAITFLTFVVSVVTAIFTTAAFVKNRLELNSIRDIISNLIKVALVVVLFSFFEAELYFLALASLGRGVFLMVANITVKKKILPDVQVKFSKFDITLVKTLLLSGMWMSLAQLSNVLMSGLDLLICNFALTATTMGLLSISKTVPVCIGSLINTIASVFAPHYTILYSKGDIKGLVKEVSFTAKIVSLIMTTPLAGFMVYGNRFYSLWQDSLSPEQISTVQILSVLACIMFLFTSHTQCLQMLNSVCNKMKIPVLINVAVGVASVVTVVLVLLFGGLGENGVFVIAGVSSVLMSLRAFFFVPVYSAKILKVKWHTFYPSVLRGLLTFIVNYVVLYFGEKLFHIYGWSGFILLCLVMGTLGYIISLPLMFNKAELKSLTNKVFKKIKR